MFQNKWNVWLVAISLGLGALGTGCNKHELLPETAMETTTDQKPVEETPATTDLGEYRYGDGSFDDGRTDSRAAISISSVTGTITQLATHSGDFLCVDTDGLDVLTINGSGFGASQGTSSVNFVGLSSYFVTSIVSWSNTQIKVKVRSSYSSLPAPTSLNNNVQPYMRVSTSAGIASRAIRVLSRVTTKRWGQCTWWANRRRGETGRSIQARGAAYSGYSGTVNANYVPATGDILIWDQVHQAFVESVTSSSTAWVNNIRTVTYTVNLSEYNVTPEVLSYYTTTVSVRETRSSTTGAISRQIVSGMYRSGRASSATNYFR